MTKPLIGITADSLTLTNSRGALEERYFLKSALANAVEMAGGQPVIVPFVKVSAQARGLLLRLDGLVISGGDFDVDPALYGERRIPKCGPANHARTKSELLLLKGAIKKGTPVLGVCGGAQLINVCLGGTLYQDIPSQLKGCRPHSQREPHTKATHLVKISDGSLLRKITKSGEVMVNSTHHQAIKKIGRGLTASAVSPDGVVESIERRSGSFLMGVQWHPEFLTKTGKQAAIFGALIRAAKGRTRALK